jgi:hypothetical protein
MYLTWPVVLAAWAHVAPHSTYAVDDTAAASVCGAVQPAETSSTQLPVSGLRKRSQLRHHPHNSQAIMTEAYMKGIPRIRRVPVDIVIIGIATLYYY